jgi:hypothetical protein
MTHYVEPPRQADLARPGPAPVSAGRAYAEVLLVFAVFFAANIISAGENLASPAPAPAGGWMDFVPSAVQELSDAAVAATAIILLSARRGITRQLLGVRLPQGADGKAAPFRFIRMAAMALLAFVVGGVVTSAAATGHLPQQPHPTAPYLLYAVAGSLFSGVVEEMVALAFVVSTLRQARRPAYEILIVAVLLRCSYHVYYGVGVIGIAVWAAVFVVLYLRFGSVIPLIVIHVLWDATQFLGLKWTAAGVIGGLLGLALLLAGLISWLVHLSSRPAPSQAGPPV